MSKILTHALIFKPRRLKSPWVHKCLMNIEYDFSSAFAIIQNTKNAWDIQKNLELKNPYEGLKSNVLKIEAENILYRIESSNQNYLDFLIIIIGVISGYFILTKLSIIWSHPDKDSVQIFIISLIVIVSMIGLYFKKEKIDNSLVKQYIDLEDALYVHRHGRSQYQVRWQNNK